MRSNESSENNLETILILSEKKPVVRSVDIAEELGFAYANHFTRLFTGKTGLSPQQYRNSQVSGNASGARKQTRQLQ